MELVASLEPERRHLYAGAVGYFAFSGVMDTAIALRTLVVRDGTLYLQAGGGIVFDSDPEDEYMARAWQWVWGRGRGGAGPLTSVRVPSKPAAPTRAGDDEQARSPDPHG